MQSRKTLDGLMDRSSRMLIPNYAELRVAMATGDATAIRHAAMRLESGMLVIVEAARSIADDLKQA